MSCQRTPFIALLFIATLFTSPRVAAEGTLANSYSFRHYNINNGLSQNSVHFILQDRLGFMWFGTKDGLNRFDGTTFKTFRFSPNGVLRDNIFYHILEDREGRIWVSSDGGIYIFDPLTENFTLFTALTDFDPSINGMISDMVIDDDGDIWISIEEKGVFYYDHLKGNHRFFEVPSLPDGMRMITLCAGNNDDLWVFPYGLPMMRINKQNGQISKFQMPGNPDFFAELGEVHKVECDGQNQLLAATSNRGMVSIDIAARTHQVLLDRDQEGKPIFARTFEKIDNRTIWVGTESGVYILVGHDNRLINLRHSNYNPFSLSDNAIYSICSDREGGVWIGSFFGGVDYYSQQYNNFESFYPIPTENSISGSRVREFCEAPDGNIWIGTEDNGLNLFDPRNGTFLPLPDQLATLYTNIHALLADGDYLWVSTFSRGLYRYNQRTGELQHYVNSYEPGSISHNSVFSLCKDRSNQLWAGTLSGLNLYDYETNRFRQVPQLEGIFVQDVYEDSQGFIWVATYSRGVYRYNPTMDDWRIFQSSPSDHASLPYNKITSVFEDSNKRIWIATQGGGFCLYQPDVDGFTTYNTTNGMPNDVVYMIEEDAESNLWISTNAGLVRFHPDRDEFTSFTVGNGLKTNQFNYQSGFRDDNGTLYFGSIDGFVRFNPSLFRETEQTVPIVFTDLYVNNNIVKPGDGSGLLRKSILHTEELILPHHKNSISLRYAVLNYSDPAASSIMYRMEGFDEEWIEPEEKQNIVYSNLKPGSYRLNIALQKTGNQGDPDIIKTLFILIRPPFWLSVWAYFIYAILLMTSIVIVTRLIEIRNLKRQRERMLLFEQEKERELYRSKIDFFTNVAHEIRTPLSLIKAPLDHVILTEHVSEAVKENLLIMGKNTDRLLNLTNQLLDFRKTESDAYLLNLKLHNVSSLLRDTFTRFRPLARQRGVEFQLELPDEDIWMQLDKEAFLKIVSNLLNNAVKYSDSYVLVKAFSEKNAQGKMFHLVTENDGDVIPEAHSEDIFKPFFQLEHKREQKSYGTGIGLALSRSLAELHKGTIEMNNRENRIIFQLILPVAEAGQEELLPSATGTEERMPQAEQKGTDRATILLVDDDSELLRFEEKFLSPHYTILEANNGATALQLLKERQVNLVVTDIMMPEVDGLELTRRIKSDVEFSHIPVILLTARVNVQSKVEGFETGADAYIEKPFSIEILIAQIANLLKNREKLRETFLRHPFIGAQSMAMNRSDEEFIQKLHLIVQENIENSEFNVESIAEEFNMSRASFYRKIKGVLDLTPNEYIRVERLKKAAQFLRQKNFKVNEICYMVGFNSPSYFSKCFQQQFGVLPKEFE